MKFCCMHIWVKKIYITSILWKSIHLFHWESSIDNIFTLTLFALDGYLACSLKSDQISFWVRKNVEPEPDVFCFNLHVQNVLQCSNVSRMFYLWSQIITGCDLKMRLDENSQRLLCFTVPHNRDVDPVRLPAFVSGVFLALLISKPYFTEPPIS